MAKAASTNQRTALCVDDDNQLRPLVGMILKNAGFAVTEVATCEEAKKAMLKEAPMFVVLDVDLPDGNGFEMARQWRGSGQPSLPILFISGGEQTERQEKAVQLNATFLPKPFTPAKFLAAVDSLLP